MLNIFDVLQITVIDHQKLTAQQVVITDSAGKPNSVMTEVLRDVVTNISLFARLDDLVSVDELINYFEKYTPLPTDVLNEYEKILDEEVLRLNLVPKKAQIEIVIDRG